MRHRGVLLSVVALTLLGVGACESDDPASGPAPAVAPTSAGLPPGSGPAGDEEAEPIGDDGLKAGASTRPGPGTAERHPAAPTSWWPRD